MIVGQVKDYFLGWNPKKTIQYKRKQLVSSKNLLAANLKELIRNGSLTSEITILNTMQLL